MEPARTRFRQLAPGLYGIKTEKQGFKTVVGADMDILVSTSPRLNIKFTEIGAVSETVVISEQALALNTADATLGNAFNSVQVRDLPLSARNVVGLLSLQPGVTSGGTVNGGRFDQPTSLWTVSMSTIRISADRTTARETLFSACCALTPDSLSEFRVTTTNPNADQGRSSGAQISLVTKSGTNAYHGSLYEYNRVTKMTANDWFNNKAGVARPALIRNNYGGSVGGPVKRDKLFFFFNYEGSVKLRPPAWFVPCRSRVWARVSCVTPAPLEPAIRHVRRELPPRRFVLRRLKWARCIRPLMESIPALNPATLALDGRCREALSGERYDHRRWA